MNHAEHETKDNQQSEKAILHVDADWRRLSHRRIEDNQKPARAKAECSASWRAHLAPG
jgi:hypothetical protein